MNLFNEINRVGSILTETLGILDDNQYEHPLQLAETLQKDMEQKSIQIRDLILSQPPTQLLGYLWAQKYKSEVLNIQEQGKNYRSDNETVNLFQFALEYLHAVWSCYDDLNVEDIEFDESKAELLCETLEQLKNAATCYCIVSSVPRNEQGEDRRLTNMEMHSKLDWILIRGRRYPVLEKEFYKYVLKPHADELQAIYEMTVDEIATGIEEIVKSMQTGIGRAFKQLEKCSELINASNDESMDSLKDTNKHDRKSASKLEAKISSTLQDMFYGGICSLTEHTNFTLPLLEDLCYLRKENKEFFADGRFKGTPMRTLPSLIKPGIKLNGNFYVTDSHFLRDVAYRAIQRGLIRRLPKYHEKWNQRQRVLIEKAFSNIFSHQLSDATVYSEVYFKDPKTHQWVEADLVLINDDILVVVEAKAGVMAMNSPATNFEQYERTIHNLVIKAYEQCKRFVEYLDSASEVSIYNIVNGKHVAIGRIRLRDFRLILPIGLTVESFTPVSTTSKNLANIKPLLDKHPFISMSVDDLFVLNRFLPTTGELFHYLKIRQKIAGIPSVFLCDEIDHLGAYITYNRYDIWLKDRSKEANLISFDSPSDPVDKYFEGETWKTAPPPRHEFPSELTAILKALDKFRPTNWLAMDVYIRNLSTSGRNKVTQHIMNLKSTLPICSIRRFLLGIEQPVQIWVCMNTAQLSLREIRHHAKVACLAMNASRVLVLRLSYNEKGDIYDLTCDFFSKPLATHPNYAELKQQAEHQLARAVDI